MSAGGWNLVHMWLTDGIVAKNWALIQELLELLLLCPVDIERLKSNNCPKLIKGLSKEGSHQGVRVTASRLVEQWLKIVKGEAAPNSVPAQIMTVPGSSKMCLTSTSIVHPRSANAISTNQVSCSEKNETDRNAQLAQSNSLAVDESHSISQIEQQQSNELVYQQISDSTTAGQPVQLPIVTSSESYQSSQLQKKQSFVILPSAQASATGGGSGPVYKITIRDGNRLLTKLETDAAHINNVIDHPSNEINVESTNDVLQSLDSQEVAGNGGSTSSTEKVEDLLPSKVTEETTIKSTDRDPSEIIPISSKDNCETDNINLKDNKDVKPVDSNKSVSDKENRDSSKKESDKKSSNTSNNSSSSSSSTDKKSSHHSSSSSNKSSSKHSSRDSSGSHRSGSNSHRSSAHRSSNSKSTSKDKTKEKDKDSKDKHHSSSSSSKHSSSSKSRSERDKEREKEKLKKDQAEKDKATLEKVQGPALSLKLGKIPKKKSEEEKSNDVLMKKSSVESKEGKDKIELKKAAAAAAVAEKKSISISIESRKTSQDSTTRPKTVKTFNSKFRSTGLEEEAKPPPPRSAKKPNQVTDKKIIVPKLSTLKRTSPLRETGSSADKKAKLSLDCPITPPADEKKGGIKLIPPKPKRKYRLLSFLKLVEMSYYYLLICLLTLHY